jgi:hypothetical protein
MAITNSFREAVSNGNVKGVRIMMKDSLLVDPSFDEYDMMARLASGVRGLYDTHDGREFISDKSGWDKNYMDKLMVQVVGNFSRERNEHLKEVVRMLYPTTSRPHSQSVSNSQRQENSESSLRFQSTTNQQSNKYKQHRNNTNLGVKIACGAVAGGVIAVVASVKVVGFVVGAVVGAVVALITNGEK